MNTPNIILGYRKSSVSSPELLSTFTGTIPEAKDATYLTLFISIEPYVELQEFSTTNLECAELEVIKVVFIFEVNFLKK